MANTAKRHVAPAEKHSELEARGPRGKQTDHSRKSCSKLELKLFPLSLDRWAAAGSARV